jgi:ferredoxin
MENHQDNSRLSCQLLMSGELDGIVLRVPEYES